MPIVPFLLFISLFLLFATYIVQLFAFHASIAMSTEASTTPASEPRVAVQDTANASDSVANFGLDEGESQLVSRRSEWVDEPGSSTLRYHEVDNDR